MVLFRDCVVAVIFIAVIIIIVRRLINYFIRIFRLPPGPWGIPLLGYLPWLTQSMHLDFVRIGKKYGGLFSVSLGNETFVILNDWSTIKSTIIEQPKIFSGRRQDTLTKTLLNEKDFAFCDGPIWQKQRNMVVQAMKHVGMDKKSMENNLTETLHVLINKLQMYEGQDIYLEDHIGLAISTFNWHFISNFEVDDVAEFKRDMDIVVYGLRPSNPIGVFPWLRFIPPNGFGFWQYQIACQSVLKQLRKLIDKHDTNMPFDENFITYHLHEFLKRSDKYPPYQTDHLLGTITDLIFASYESTVSTVLAGFFYLCQHPEIQDKAQNELDAVVGRDRAVNLSDLPALVYLDALISEIHRVSSVIPLSIPHRVLQTVKIDEYELPQGIICLQNIYAVHRDPQLWNEPDKFQPERFINEENKVDTPPYLMPFSVGPRMCIGQEFASLQLRFLFANLLQKFSFSFPKSVAFPVMETVFGLAAKPKLFKLTILNRM